MIEFLWQQTKHVEFQRITKKAPSPNLLQDLVLLRRLKNFPSRLYHTWTLYIQMSPHPIISVEFIIYNKSMIQWRVCLCIGEQRFSIWFIVSKHSRNRITPISNRLFLTPTNAYHSKYFLKIYHANRKKDWQTNRNVLLFQFNLLFIPKVWSSEACAHVSKSKESAHSFKTFLEPVNNLIRGGKKMIYIRNTLGEWSRRAMWTKRKQATYDSRK